MRSNLRLTWTHVMVGLLALASTVVLSAGSLTPPAGPVSPTMKPLEQIEPRIAINAFNTPGDADSIYRISQPGSYYLTGHVLGAVGRRGIEIASSGVSIDLLGYTVRGVAGSLEGIATNGGAYDSLVVRNGAVSNWGGDGVALAAGGLGSTSLIENVLAVSNGGTGLSCNRLGIIRACSAYDNGGAGISGGSGGLIESCTAYSNGGDGLVAGSGGTVRACSARLNDGSGIVATACCATVTGCTSSSNTGDGIRVASSCRVAENNCNGNGAGIHVTGTENRVEGNNATDNARGIDVDAVDNLIIRNSARGSTVANYDIVAGNTVGPTVTSANIASSHNPHANYEF